MGQAGGLGNIREMKKAKVNKITKVIKQNVYNLVRRRGGRREGK